VRLSTANLPTEIAPLVGAVNGALDRLQRSLQNQQAFTADAAHELRTPLAILRTRVETLQDKETAQTLIADIEHMTRTVGQLLELAEVDSFSVGEEKRADLLAIASDVAALLAPLAIAQGKTIAVLSDDVPVVVRGDREMIYRALRNLVENAVRFTPTETSVDIEIRSDGEICVSDRGPGVSDDVKAMLFRRFWRQDRSVAGSGLGLAIVQGIVEAHGATIHVRRRDNGGAQFCIGFTIASAVSG
jgi:signal transduction histidine kinase